MEQGYKQSPLGPIPENWEVKSVKDISTIKGRIGYRGYTIDDIVNDGDGAISLSPSNIVDGKLQFNPVTSITWEKYYESPEIMLHNGDIVMVKTGSSFGKVAFVDNLPHETTINPQFVIINNIKCDNKWLCYLFDSDCIQKNVHKIVVGGAIPTMSQEEIANFRIPIPPLPEQHRIVSVLSLWDTAIEKQTALIEKLTLRKRGLMQQLLTGKKRLKGFSGEWKEVRLGEVASINRGGSPRPIEDYITDGEGYNWIKIGDVGVDAKYITSTEEKIIKEGLSKTRFVKSGDFILSNSMSFGRPYILKIDGCIHDGWLVIQEYSQTFNIDFLYYILGYDTTLAQYKSMAAGSGVLNLNKEIVKEVILKTPSIDEQKAIASILINADKEIEIQKQKLAAIQEQKKGLMQVLLTGKKRVK